MTATRSPDAAPAAVSRRVAELVRAAAAPVVSAVLVTGLLSAWVITGGAGTVTRLQVEVSLAAIPMRAYLVSQASTIHRAPTYLTIRNLGNEPDALLSVSTPISSHVILTGPPGPGGARPVVTSLAIPARGTITLAPFGADVVLLDPALYETSATVPLTLTFRRAGKVHVSAVVTAPGSP